MWALAIPGVGLLSLFVFICSFIPIAGCFISTVPIAFTALTEYGFVKARPAPPHLPAASPRSRRPAGRTLKRAPWQACRAWRRPACGAPGRSQRVTWRLRRTRWGHIGACAAPSGLCGGCAAPSGLWRIAARRGRAAGPGDRDGDRHPHDRGVRPEPGHLLGTPEAAPAAGAHRARRRGALARRVGPAARRRARPPGAAPGRRPRRSARGMRSALHGRRPHPLHALWRAAPSA